jgi:hypothetical protein
VCVVILYLDADGPRLTTESAAADVVGAALSEGADTVVVPVPRLDPRFFDLRTGLAGAIAQKMVNYRLRLVILGDIAAQVAASTALRDWVFESNRGRDVWFVADAAELDARLAARR